VVRGGLRIAFVTGAARGLGAALVAELGARGFEVLGVVRPPAAGEASRAGDGPGRAHRCIGCDLGDLDAVERVVAPLFAQAAARQPVQAVLVNNAATVEPAGVLDTLPAAAVTRALAVNLAAPLLLAQAFCRAFAPLQADRRIINVSSGAAASPIPGEGLYCIAKAGLEMLTRMLAAEQAGSGIQAITLRPGIIDTGMQAWLRSQADATVPSVGMFRGFHARGELVPAQEVARKTVERLVVRAVESGRTYRYADL
jgi:NAD(P)-dependent dehydrogenase (short-subunit alcohol dehydrogenase family)